MHTAHLSPDLFSVQIEGRAASAAELLPGWTRHDRFGILLHEPFGALGASLLIQAVVAHFFAHRRAEQYDAIPMYPEIYAFHVGGPHGDHSMFDFWPGQKEVHVACDAGTVLDAINERAITRLAVPDGVSSPPTLLWPELSSARNRVVSSFIYGSEGDVDPADVSIRGTSPVTEENPAATLDLRAFAAQFAASPDFDTRRWVSRVQERSTEVSDDVRVGIQARRQAHGGWLALERYRRTSLEDALTRLVPSTAGTP